jgi:Tfp pilus assembly protein PilX
MMRPRSSSQGGFAYIAAVLLLVVVAGIAVALLRLTDTQRSTVNGALLGAHANLTARAGLEWAFRDLPNRCAQTPVTLNDFSDATGFRVRVACTSSLFTEGDQPAPGTASGTEPRTIRIYRIEAIACNAADCPDGNSVARPDYVERARIATVCLDGNNTSCE